LDAARCGSVDRIADVLSAQLSRNFFRVIDYGIAIGQPATQMVGDMLGKRAIAPANEEVMHQMPATIAVHRNHRVYMIKK